MVFLDDPLGQTEAQAPPSLFGRKSRVEYLSMRAVRDPFSIVLNRNGYGLIVRIGSGAYLNQPFGRINGVQRVLE